jgi:hypothetical protein
MARFVPVVVFVVLVPGCASAPASRTPLSEQLAVVDASRLEQATRTCLEQGGWKVDPLPRLVGGARRFSAVKGKGETYIYLYDREMKPRITGGPDYDDPFWTCLGKELGSSKAEPASSTSLRSGAIPPSPSARS